MEYSGRDAHHSVSCQVVASAWVVFIVCSFHLDHAAALTYIMEKASRDALMASYRTEFRVDKLQRREGEGVHDPSNESSSQVHDAGLRTNGVRRILLPALLSTDPSCAGHRPRTLCSRLRTFPSPWPTSSQFQLTKSLLPVLESLSPRTTPDTSSELACSSLTSPG